MLSRSIFRFGRINVRLFSTATPPVAKPVTPPAPVQVDPLAEAKRDFDIVDFGTIPTYTLGTYGSQMEEAVCEYLANVKKIPGGKASVTFFETITVYNFMEYVPLKTAAQVRQVGENEFKITVLDPANAPQVEQALKQSSYKMQTSRKSNVIDVKITVDKSSCAKAAEVMAEEAKKSISATHSAALNRLKGRDAKVESVLDVLKRKNVESIDQILAQKKDQLK